MILVDTCVLLDVSTNDPIWLPWSVEELALWSVRGPLLINPLIFAEWCIDFGSFEAADQAWRDFGLQWTPIPPQALYLAAQAHRLYRRRGGTRGMVLPDFLIDAHAAVSQLPLLTRDRRRFDSYFEGLQIVAPA